MQQVETQDPVVLASRQPYHIQALRAHLMRRLTEKQYRRVSLLFGFDGPPMSQREVAEAEGVARFAILNSKQQVVGRTVNEETDRLVRFVAEHLQKHWPEKDQETLRGHAQLLKHRMGERWVGGERKVKEPGKLSADAYLWLLWVVGTFFILCDTHTREGRGKGGQELPRSPSSPAAPAALMFSPTRHKTDKETGEKVPLFYPHEREVMWIDRQWEDRGAIKVRPSGTWYESDRFTPKSKYDRTTDETIFQAEAGQLTKVEFDRDMVLALADDRVYGPHEDEERRATLKQELEWAFGARELGALTREECDRRVSRLLRAYVRGEG